MLNPVETTDREITSAPNWSMLLAAMATIAVTNVAFIFSMVGMLSWQESALIVMAAAALTGGTLFSAVTMQSLDKDQ